MRSWLASLIAVLRRSSCALRTTLRLSTEKRSFPAPGGLAVHDGSRTPNARRSSTHSVSAGRSSAQRRTCRPAATAASSRSSFGSSVRFRRQRGACSSGSSRLDSVVHTKSMTDRRPRSRSRLPGAGRSGPRGKPPAPAGRSASCLNHGMDVETAARRSTATWSCAWPQRDIRAPACSVNVRSALIEAMEAEGFCGRGVIAATFGNVQVADIFDGRDDGGRIVARLAGPLPVRLAAVSSQNVTSRMFSRVTRSGGARPDLRVYAASSPSPITAAARWSAAPRDESLRSPAG